MRPSERRPLALQFWAMRHSPHYQQLLAGATQGSGDPAHKDTLFAELQARGPQGGAGVTPWAHDLLLLRQRRIAVRNAVMLDSQAADAIRRWTINVYPVRFQELCTDCAAPVASRAPRFKNHVSCLTKREFDAALQAAHAV